MQPIAEVPVDSPAQQAMPPAAMEPTPAPVSGPYFAETLNTYYDNQTPRVSTCVLFVSPDFFAISNDMHCFGDLVSTPKTGSAGRGQRAVGRQCGDAVRSADEPSEPASRLQLGRNSAKPPARHDPLPAGGAQPTRFAHCLVKFQDHLQTCSRVRVHVFVIRRYAQTALFDCAVIVS